MLYRAIKQVSSSSMDQITFEEFSKGVMDFPFLLEQFQQELEELGPGDRTGKGLMIDIESIEEEDEGSPKNSRSGLGLYLPNARAFHFPSSKSSDTTQMQAAYHIFANLSKQSFESVPAPTPTAVPSDQPEIPMAELVEMTLLVLSKIQGRFQRSDYGQLVSALAEGAKQLCLQTESTTKSYEDSAADSQRQLELAYARAAEMERRCQMAETSYTLLFDRLKSVEEEASLEHNHREESQQETFHLRDLLKSEQAQGQIVSGELEEIQQAIEAKEEQIEALQRAVRRLNSRKVLHELPSAELIAVQELRAARKERMSSGSAYVFKERTPARMSPVISPTSARLSAATRGSETRQLNILNAMLSDKQKQIKTDAKQLQDQERRLEQWEFHLKCRETDLESSANAQVEALHVELESTRKRLFSEQNKVTQLEMALNELSRQSMNSRLDITAEGYESLGVLRDMDLQPRERHLTVVSSEGVQVLTRKPLKEKFEAKKKEGCCGFF